MGFKYFYGTQADQFSFIRIPRVLITDKKFAGLSASAKVLYGLLLDRMGLSMKNGWLDKENRVYIIYQITEIQEDLGVSKKKAIDYLSELEEFDLIEKKRRGLGLASIIYVKNFMEESDETAEETEVDKNRTSRGDNLGTSAHGDQEDTSIRVEHESTGNCDVMRIKDTELQENKTEVAVKNSRSTEMGTSRSVDLGTSRSAQIAPQEVSIREPQEVSKSTPLNNYNNINNTYWNYNKSNLILSDLDEMGCDEIGDLSAYFQLIKENIEYEALLQEYPFEKETVQGIFELICEMVVCRTKEVTIASNVYPTELVKSKFLKLRFEHVSYVIACLQSNTTKVKNIKKYLLAALFNAPSTMDSFYRSEVNHDMPQFAKENVG